MKIMHIGEYVKGGVATYLENIVSTQVKEPLVTDIYILYSNNINDFNLLHEKIKEYPYHYTRSIRGLCKAMFTIRSLIKLHNPDIVHIHSTYAGFMVRTVMVFCRRRPKIVYCAHGWSFLMDIGDFKRSIFAAIERILSRSTDFIINISQNEQSEAVAVGIPERKTTVVYNGVRSSNISVRNADDFIKVKTNKINLLFVGRLDYQKGADILFELFQEYHFPNLSLSVIGSSVLGNQSIVIPNNVEFLGWIPNQQLDFYYRRADAVIIPSRWEGFGMVAVEAMRNKTAVIASNRGALTELVAHGVNGYIIDIEQREKMAEFLNKLSIDELHKMGIEGYGIYKEKFTIERMHNDIMSVYSKVLEKS